jgi:hypothetical protein
MPHLTLIIQEFIKGLVKHLAVYVIWSIIWEGDYERRVHGHLERGVCEIFWYSAE